MPEHQDQSGSREAPLACAVCGTLYSGGHDGAVCPVCLLRRALKSDSRQQTGGSVEDGRFDQYELLRDEDGQPIELGRGAMGITYKAFDVDLRYPVTLKVISQRYVGDESARLRFLREARAAASVRHPNVASVFHLGKTGDHYFYAM